jgi:hypothetical protein
MSTDPHDLDYSPARDHPREPPTLPLPPLWRLVVAGIVIVSVLYLMYMTALEEEPAEPAPRSGITAGWS